MNPPTALVAALPLLAALLVGGCGEPRTIDLNEHHEILDLVVAQDAEAAAALTRRHIEKSLTASAIDALEDRDRRGTQTA